MVGPGDDSEPVATILLPTRTDHAGRAGIFSTANWVKVAASSSSWSLGSRPVSPFGRLREPVCAGEMAGRFCAVPRTFDVH